MDGNTPGGWLLGSALSVLVALGVAGTATFLDWRINPAGLFQGTAGTNWPIVWETLVSWFLPTLLVATLILVPALVVYRRWKA